MCYLYNTTNTSAGCNANYNGCYASSQRMCRDGNGNVWARTGYNNNCSTSNCHCCHCCNCCNCCHSCSNSCCSCNNGNTSQNDTANGSYGCITICGVSVNGATQNTTTGTTQTSRCCRNRCGYSYY